jgi:hypothetical protein
MFESQGMSSLTMMIAITELFDYFFLELLLTNSSHFSGPVSTDHKRRFRQLQLFCWDVFVY